MDDGRCFGVFEFEFAFSGEITHIEKKVEFARSPVLLLLASLFLALSRSLIDHHHRLGVI